MFLKHVQYNQYDQAVEIKNECDRVGVIETPVVLSVLLKLWTATANEEKALHVLQTLQKKHPKFKVDSYKIIDLATLLVSKDRLVDAENLIDSLSPCKDKKVAYLSNNVWRLLEAASKFGVKHSNEMNIAGQFLKILAEKRYCEFTNALLGSVIKEYIDKKQIHEAVAAFEHYALEYKKTPQNVSLLTLLIEIANSKNSPEFDVSQQEAVEYLQRVIDLTEEIHGTENANVNVILAFASSGHDQQVRKILLNPNVKFNSHLLMKALGYLKNRLQIKVVMTIARCARGLSHTSLNEERLYELLLNDFVRTNDYMLAIRLYEEIQNDGSCVVTKIFKKTLADLLEKNNQPLPEKLQALTK